jgi:hypothetical protein
LARTNFTKGNNGLARHANFRSHRRNMMPFSGRLAAKKPCRHAAFMERTYPHRGVPGASHDRRYAQ